MFFFSSWAGKECPFTFIAAQFAVKNLSFCYLYDRFLETMSALSFHGFVVTAISGDGASENRVMFLDFATLTVDDLICLGVFPSEWIEDPLIPKDLPVAFWNLFYEEGTVLVFIQSDMPHCVNKIVNARKGHFILQCSQPSIARKFWQKSEYHNNKK
jgi:hypothetical protein